MTRFLISVVCLALAAGWVGQVAAATPERVSIVQLIADPGAYDGKLVNVVGYSRLRGEYAAIFLGESDGVHEVYRNGISIELVNKQDLKRKPLLDRQYVYVEGVFHANGNGSDSLFSGKVDQITRFELWQK